MTVFKSKQNKHFVWIENRLTEEYEYFFYFPLQIKIRQAFSGPLMGDDTMILCSDSAIRRYYNFCFLETVFLFPFYTPVCWWLVENDK